MTEEEVAWNRAWEIFQCKPLEELFPALVSLYSQKGRYYHNRQHIHECFVLLDTVWPGAPRTLSEAEMVLALWFHDSVYDPESANNEDDSARFAWVTLEKPPMPLCSVLNVMRMVVNTKGHIKRQALGTEQTMMLDIDLSILGAPIDRFWQYEQQIRKEYAHVPEEAFCRGRVAVLESFLKRDSIYSLLGHLEEPARINLNKSIEQLRWRLASL